MDMTDTRKLHAGQTYDPGYDVPDLAIGQEISGRTVIAAVRQVDCPGYLPGLHTVTAYAASEYQPWVTWEVAWQPAGDEPGGQWTASSGHYFYADQAREALLDMIRRAGRAPGEEV